MENPVCLYRFFDEASELLYVGISKNFENRLRTHQAEKPWQDQILFHTIEIFPNRSAAFKAELNAIK